MRGDVVDLRQIGMWAQIDYSAFAAAPQHNECKSPRIEMHQTVARVVTVD
jgi:hypothetical protein